MSIRKMFRLLFYSYFVCFIVFVHSIDVDNSKILCSESFCEEFRKKNPCPPLPQNCLIQNTTHNGLNLPFDGPCNCCDYCVENLGLGDACVIGQPDGPLPTKICGDGLYCDSKTIKCIENPTPCIKELQDYIKRKKEGKTGHLESRPQCDKRGQYQPVKCILEQTCFCVDKQGNRIFGEMPYNIQAADVTKCGCSRIISDINKVLGETKYTPKRALCISNGNFDSIQCVGKDCVCVNAFDGDVIDPKQKPININLVSEMSCINKEIHPNGTYYQNCEKKYVKALEEQDSYKSTGFDVVLGMEFPNCQLDGRYAPLQNSANSLYCADPEGEQLEDFTVLKTNALAKSMNCHCARARTIATEFEKPSCCKNGNYECIQCRKGLCRCVDTNGLQIVQEVDISEKDTLKCKNCVNGCTK